MTLRDTELIGKKLVKAGLKSEYIEQFKQLHKEIIDWCTIRYIF